ncbi:MAG TPA: formylglycine-generating enzyme family protein [Gemmataceae bacterium]|nr:formylglycine-generating enzyme family protein [Gemmataceae bacterium]
MRTGRFVRLFLVLILTAAVASSAVSFSSTEERQTGEKAADPTPVLDLGEGIKLQTVLVKKGTFQQGSPPNEVGRNNDESSRRVTISQDFYIGKYLVTRSQFSRFVRETGYRTEAETGPSGGFGFDGNRLVQRKEFNWRNPGFPQTDDHPVCLVTFDDAQAFIAWLAKKTRRRVSLPSEAQWEYACRAGTTTRFYNGDADEDAGAIAWYRTNAKNGTRPVGQKKANALGLYDMCGNVYEWCRDWYGPYPPGAVVDPEETRNDLSDPPRRVLRGGSWLREAQHCRSAARYRNTPGSRNADNGFRIVASVKVILEKEDRGQAGAQPGPVGGPVFAVLFGQGEFVWLGLLVAGGAVVFLLLVKRLWDRSTFGGGQRFTTRRLPRDLELRPQADGFWIESADLARGSVIRYRCQVLGTMRTGSVTFEPGKQGQYVYTGGTPTDIEILEIIPPERATALSLDDWDESAPLPPALSPDDWEEPAPPPPEPFPPPQAFQGHPPAY